MNLSSIEYRPRFFENVSDVGTSREEVILFSGQYSWVRQGSFGGAIRVELLGPDGLTWLQLASSNNTNLFLVRLCCGQRVRMNLPGGTPANVYASLEYLGE